jgi:hypothetical protein
MMRHQVQSHASIIRQHKSIVGYSESYIRSQMGVMMLLAFSSAICRAIFILSNPEMALLQRGQGACKWWWHQLATQ